MIRLQHTVNTRKGVTGVFQCAQCGTLIATRVQRQFGPCPACGHPHWLRQHMPTTGIGPFIIEENT